MKKNKLDKTTRIVKNKYMVNEHHKLIVEQGGGVYVPGMLGSLVLFNSPQTQSTLALADDQLTAEAVRTRIHQSDKEFGL